MTGDLDLHLHVWNEITAERSVVELTCSDRQQPLVLHFGARFDMSRAIEKAIVSCLVSHHSSSSSALLNSTDQCLTLLHAIVQCDALNRIETIWMHRLVLTDALVDALAQTIARATNLKSFFAFRQLLSVKLISAAELLFFVQIFSKVRRCALVSMLFAS